MYLRAAGQSLDILGRSGTTFRGIEGGGVPASLRVAVPFGLDATTTGILEVDAVGGAADGCPFLMPNKTCIRHRCSTIHDAFGDGTQDRLLIMPEIQLSGAATPTCVGIRLLCTDSGHYLVPVATATTTPTLYNDLAERIYRRITPIIGASLSKGGRSESRLSSDSRDVNHNYYDRNGQPQSQQPQFRGERPDTVPELRSREGPRSENRQDGFSNRFGRQRSLLPPSPPQGQQHQPHSSQQNAGPVGNPKGFDGGPGDVVSPLLRTSIGTASSYGICGPSIPREGWSRSPGEDAVSDGLKSSPDGDPAEACNYYQNHVNHLHNDQRRVTFDLNHKPDDNHNYHGSRRRRQRRRCTYT